MSVKFDSGGGRKKKNPGFAAAIGLCLAAVCLVAAATAINGRLGKSNTGNDYISNYVSEESDSVWLGVEDPSDSEEVYIDTPTADSDAAAVSDLPADEQTSAQPEDDAEDVFAEIPDSGTPGADDLAFSGDDAVTAAKTISYRMPIDGDILKEYSGDELVYCSTMCDWRVHQGVDISGTLDCEVYAAADGVVVDFVEDMLYGYTAIIEHDDGSMLYYCGLSSVPKVTSGLVVKAGDVIGYLGVVPSEAGDPVHLHLAMMKDGSFVDPIRAMGL